MPTFICTARGTQYPPSEAVPAACLSCNDERQFVPASGLMLALADVCSSGQSGHR
jgi:hypothetical protein